MTEPDPAFPFSLVESLSNTGARTVYGEPVVAGPRTVIPVARVAYGFGGGADGTEGGGGAGGGVVATPVGVLELTESETRFVRVRPYRRLVTAGLIGVLVGYLLGRRR